VIIICVRPIDRYFAPDSGRVCNIKKRQMIRKTRRCEVLLCKTMLRDDRFTLFDVRLLSSHYVQRASASNMFALLDAYTLTNLHATHLHTYMLTHLHTYMLHTYTLVLHTCTLVLHTYTLTHLCYTRALLTARQCLKHVSIRR
jgi:hypothetical protein